MDERMLCIIRRAKALAYRNGHMINQMVPYHEPGIYYAWCSRCGQLCVAARDGELRGTTHLLSCDPGQRSERLSGYARDLSMLRRLIVGDSGISVSG